MGSDTLNQAVIRIRSGMRTRQALKTRVASYPVRIPVRKRVGLWIPNLDRTAMPPYTFDPVSPIQL